MGSVGATSASKGIPEGLDEIPTVTRLDLPPELRHSPASKNIIELTNAVSRQVCRNVKCWRDAQMALSRTAAAFEGRQRLPSSQGLHAAAHPQAVLEKHRTKPEDAFDPVADAA